MLSARCLAARRPSRIGNKVGTFISVGGFEYEDEVEGFIGLFCQKCDQEIGYDPCPDCDADDE